MSKLRWILALWTTAFGISLSAKAQDSIYTFPFHLDSKLLVFEGKMNGVPTQFAFDTGAAMGLASTQSEEKGRLEIKGKKIKMRDSNNEIQKVSTGLSKTVEVGGFQIQNVRSLVNDMDYLYCMDFFLLGQDVIKQLNWEIDFDKMQIRVSKSPFPVNPEWAKIPIHYQGNRPFTKFSFGGQNFPDALIDFGYVQVMDFPDHLPEIKEFLSEKDSLGLSNPNISTSMGALGQKTYPSRSIFVDSLSLGGAVFDRIPIDFEEGSYPKVGVGFFEKLSHKTILNHSENAYYLEKRQKVEFSGSTNVAVLYENGKLVLIAKPMNLTPDDTKIEVGDEILSINGFSAANFTGICAYFTWSNEQKNQPVEIVKMDGSKLFFPIIPLK